VKHVDVARELRARINPSLQPGIARVANDHVGELGGFVEVSKP